jgi:hypothetical protein
MQKWLNKEVLFTHAHPREDGVVQDGIVRRLSTSGKYVLIDHRWYAVDKIAILEEAPAPPAKNPTDDRMDQGTPVQTSGTPNGSAAPAGNVVPGPFGAKTPATTAGPDRNAPPGGSPAPTQPPIGNAHVAEGAEKFPEPKPPGAGGVTTTTA